MLLVSLNSLTSGWAIASALAVAGLGLSALVGGHSRARGALPFGLFAIAWGAQIITINVAGLVEGQVLATHLYLISLAAWIVLPYFLTEFAASYAPQRTTGWLWRPLRAGAAILALTGAGLLLLQPSFLFQGVTLSQGVWSPVWGPGYFYVAPVPVFATLALALWALWSWVQRAPTERARRPATAVLAGLALYAGFASSNNLVVFGSFVDGLPALSMGLLLAALATLAILCVVLGVIGLRLSARAVLPEEARRNRWLSIALLVPPSWGAIEAWLVLGPLAPYPWFTTVGLWRLAAVGAIAYGLARWRTYDLPQRINRAAGDATGFAGATAAGATFYAGTTLLFAGAVAPVVGGVTVTAAALFPSVKFARRLFGGDPEDNPVERERELFEQRVDTYRAALEDAIARGDLAEDEQFLAALRERFDITDREDRILRYYARLAVVPTDRRDTTEAYDRLRILGEGGAGRTWLARDRARDRLVVLKEPLERWHQEPAILQAASEEARLAAKVRHPHVVEVERVVEDEGRPVLVMEHMEGGSLADLLSNQGVLEWRRAVAITHDVLEGLQAVHRQGIIHRDIKPANVLLDGAGAAKLSDFGIAAPRSSAGTRVQGGSAPLGTEAFMAPEVRAQASTGDECSDVWSTGALLHSCLYASPPSEGVRVENDVPEELTKVLARALATDPEQRFGSAHEFAQALGRTIGG